MIHHDDLTAVDLTASTGATYGTAEVHSKAGTVALWLGDVGEFIGFGADLSPACARELAAAGADAIALGDPTATGEILGSMLNTIHNLHFYQTIMAEMRSAIETGTLESWSQQFARDRASEERC